MGTLKYAAKMLKTDIRQTLLYIISVVFSTLVLFYGYNIMDSNSQIPRNGGDWQMLQILLMFLTLLSIFIVFFSNSYFITYKSKEYALAELGGVCSYRLVGMLCFQNIVVGIVGGLIGIILGIITTPVLSLATNGLLGVKGGIQAFSMEGLVTTIIITIFIIIPYVIIGDFSYIINKPVKEMIYGESKVFTPRAKKFSLPELPSEWKQLYPPKISKVEVKPSKIVAIIIYFIPITIIFVDSSIIYFMLFFFLVISIIGIQKLLRIYFPEKILELKSGKCAEDKIKLISLSNLHYSLRKINYLIIILALSSVTLIYLTGTNKNSHEVELMSLLVYIYSIVALGTSILYKFIIEASYRKHIFRQLSLIGYTKKQMKKIIREEVIMIYAIAIVVPLIHILIYLYKFIGFGVISIKLSTILLGIFIGIFLLMIPISYRVYKKLVLSI
jgi:putative ABC transport system permease protein